MKYLRKFAGSAEKDSFANKLRRKRFELFKQLVNPLQKPVKILDVGGTEDFWIKMNFVDSKDVLVTITNIDGIKVSLPNFSFVKADAKDLSVFQDKSFDIVFSNSVIEHLGSFAEQEKMADEIMRVAKNYFIQTPNYHFPVEPHFLFPFFQYLPISIKIFLVRNFIMGWFKKCKTKSEAEQLIDSFHLLKKRELLDLFPNSKLYREKLYGLTKSFIVYKPA